MASTVTASREIAQLFQVLSDPTRLEIIRRLRRGERCVCDLMDLLDAAQSRLSFHLKVLRDAGLVSDRRDGRWMYYTLVPGALDAAQSFLGDLTPDPRALPILNSDTCCE